MNRWSPDWIGLVALVVYVLLVFAVLGCLEPRSIPVDQVRLGGRYRVAKRRVRVVSIRPGTHTVTLALVDVDTRERAVVTYHHGARFKPRRFGP